MKIQKKVTFSQKKIIKIMGFSSALQGASSHDAILSRVDAELRLLENMKRCLTARVKADREYAIALNSFVLQVCYL